MFCTRLENRGESGTERTERGLGAAPASEAVREKGAGGGAKVKGGNSPKPTQRWGIFFLIPSPPRGVGAVSRRRGPRVPPGRASRSAAPPLRRRAGREGRGGRGGRAEAGGGQGGQGEPRSAQAGQGRASRAEQRRRRRPPCPSMSAREAVTYLPEKGLYCQRLPGRRARGAPPPPRKGKRADTMGFYGTLKMIFYKVSGRPPASPPLPAGARPRRARGQGGAGGGRGGGGPRAETCRRRGLPPGRSCSQRAAGERCQRLVAGGDAECSLLPLLFVFYIY